MTTTRPCRAVLTALALAALAACSSPSPTTRPGATARLAPTSGNTAVGTVTFTPLGERLQISGQLSGLKPSATHAIHIHETGDCSSPDAMSAGGHFNVSGQPHGNPATGAHHAGDLPSLTTDANGVARFSYETAVLSLAGANNVIGRAVVVHRDPDDYRSQPAGNSGPRLACGVIARS